LAARMGNPTLPDETVILRGQLVIRQSARLPSGYRGRQERIE
jgi:hypothetical protein